MFLQRAKGRNELPGLLSPGSTASGMSDYCGHRCLSFGLANWNAQKDFIFHAALIVMTAGLLFSADSG